MDSYNTRKLSGLIVEGKEVDEATSFRKRVRAVPKTKKPDTKPDPHQNVPKYIDYPDHDDEEEVNDDKMELELTETLNRIRKLAGLI